jgi:TatD DNase family protein
MALIDTHAHIYAEEFDGELDHVLQRAKDAGVSHIFMPNIDSTSIDAMLKIEANNDFCHAMMGLHPCYVKENYLAELAKIEQQLGMRKFWGIGEVGLDYYWDKTFVDEQQTAFERQIQWAIDLKIPVIIHSRDSLDQTIAAIEKFQKANLNGIFHCFNGSVDQAKKIVDVGFLLGVGGVVTYKNAGMDQVFPQISIENLVLETDAPYLSPVPYRGKRNEPSYIHEIAIKLAEIMNMDIAELADRTSANAQNLFKLNI